MPVSRIRKNCFVFEKGPTDSIDLLNAFADVCTGGGNLLNGPDDTILTVYQNLLGMDSTLVFLLVGESTLMKSAFVDINFLIHLIAQHDLLCHESILYPTL